MPNPVNESAAYMEHRSEATSPTPGVGAHNEVSVMIMSTLPVHEFVNNKKGPDEISIQC